MKYLPLCLLLSVTVHASERDISIPWCRDTMHSMQWEIILPDKTRVDCVTDTTAWEVGFPNHWEDVGQAYHYARILNKKPGIAIIVQSENDFEYLFRLSEDLRKAGDHQTDIELIDLRP